MQSLKIILSPCLSPGILSAKLWIREGSRADPDKKQGLHNLLGSLLIRGCGPYNNLEMADLVERSGASLVCETYEDGLMLSLKCTKQRSSDLLPLLSLMITQPLINDDQVKLERSLSIKAIKRQRENPFQIALKGWKRLAYHNHPYSKETLGIKEDLENISTNDVFNLSKKILYRQKALIISGSLPANINDYFKDLKKTCSNSKRNQEDPIYKGSINTRNKSNLISLTNQTTNQVVLLLGKVTTSHSNPDDLALRILNCHLGCGMSSVLFQRLREEKGLAYDVGIYQPVREFDAPFLIHASSTKEKAMETLINIKECWMNSQTKLISESELELAKAKFKGNIAHNSQTISQRAERKAHLIGLQINEDYDLQNLKRIEHIDNLEILRVAQLYLKDPILSLCGPIEVINKLSDYWTKDF
ncbi:MULTISPECIES: M16 family metallopeptidase [unclassified Prochlorococcus]|uniref:M16 family metallopeptidase n=1 Tax=unclassified Prochlorococcus TaxID=2627481 RepID=UPI000533A58A|nr:MULTISPECIES: pitrilysin family protein [unclassified Prochlorococcus]KGG15134.1 Insulinase family (Peptidase family M16) [Prochlorococcus sp. MIT 0602]KGG17406.1 Insulinase family (Peptidase family M16) [Prochlorococcus sp. MIT 0603]